MSVEQDKLIQVFSEAVAQAGPEERERYLAEACGSDGELRRQVDSLLEAHAQSGDFLRRSVVSPGEPAAGEALGASVGPYRLREKIGEGGCGVVYVAEQEEPVRRKVTLKVIKLGMDTRSVVARFEAERQALALMDHPNIAKVFEAGATETGRPYFVMELVRGLRITDYCDQHQLSTRERLDLFIQVCRAVQHAHQKGIIHRDLKPSNILVTVNDGVAVPKVIDFGIAKATEGRLTDKTVYTELHHFIGTPAYMSPEQAELTGVDIDTRSDIYSLGVLLYELLTGGTPFDQQELLQAGLDAMRQTIRAKEPPRPSTRLSALGAARLAGVAQARRSEPPKLIHLVRGDLDWIVMKCLEKDRARRYETANGLAMDLQRHLKHEPVVARPASSLYRLQKLVRRNKLAFAAAAGVVGALLLGLGLSTWLLVEKNRAYQRVVTAEREQSRLRQAAEAAQANEAKLRQGAEAQAYMVIMRPAQHAWEQNDLERLRELLDATATYPGRGFEWYYWQRQTHLDLKTLRGHTGVIWSVAFSPDGRRIVTGADDRMVKVWNAVTGKELLTLRGRGGAFAPVAFSPDGRRLATGGGNNTLKVWEADTGRELLTLKGRNGPITAVAFSPDGQRLVTGSKDAMVVLWDAANGNQLLTFDGHSNRVNAVVFSPDGRRILTGSDDGTVRLWDAASAEPLLVLKGWANAVAFSPDGQRIVAGLADGTARLWQSADGRELRSIKAHAAAVASVAFSPDNRRIATAGYEDTQAKVWDAESGSQLFTLAGHSGGVASVAFCPDGNRILTGSHDATAKVWDADNGRQSLTLKGLATNVSTLAFSPDGQRIAAASQWATNDNAVRVWDAVIGTPLLTFTGHVGTVRCVAFSPDGQRLATSSWDQTAKVWDVVRGTNLLVLSGHRSNVSAVVFSPDGRWMATGSWDRAVKLWDAATGTLLRTLTGHSDNIHQMAFSPDSRRVVAGSSDKTAIVWDTASGANVLTLAGHTGDITSVGFSSHGDRILTSSGGDGTVRVWDASAGTNLLTIRGHKDYNLLATFSPDGRRILIGSGDGTAQICDSVTGEALLTLKVDPTWILAVAFSPTGRQIAVGCGDGTVRIWEAAAPQQVEAWEREEKAHSDHLEARAKLAGSIKQWLILAPIPLAPGQSGIEGLDAEQIAGEGGLRPKPGEVRTIGGVELKWREVAPTNEVLDFNALLGQVTTQSVAYAVCYLSSETEQRGLRMLVGSDDEAKIYLNGKQIYKCLEARPLVPDEDTVPDLTLNAGLNVLVFKVVNETEEWQGALRFTDPAGQPVKGVRVTLAPP